MSGRRPTRGTSTWTFDYSLLRRARGALRVGSEVVKAHLMTYIVQRQDSFTSSPTTGSTRSPGRSAADGTPPVTTAATPTPSPSASTPRAFHRRFGGPITVGEFLRDTWLPRSADRSGPPPRIGTRGSSSTTSLPPSATYLCDDYGSITSTPSTCSSPALEDVTALGSPPRPCSKST